MAWTGSSTSIDASGSTSRGGGTCDVTTTSRPETSAADAYSFVASKFRKEDGEGGPIWNAATQTFEFLFHVPTDVKKHGAVGAGRKYLSNLFYFLGRQVAEN